MAEVVKLVVMEVIEVMVMEVVMEVVEVMVLVIGNSLTYMPFEFQKE